MSNFVFTRNSGRSNRFPLLLVLLLGIAIALPALGDDKSKDEQTLQNAAQLISDMLGSGKVPSDVLSRTDCIIILPNVKKFGFGIGGSGGRGPMSCRGGEDYSAKWSAPAMFTIGGASVGLQIGGSSTDFVLLVMSQKGVEALLQGKTKLGNEATAAAGPSGATHAGTMGGTDIYTYARASGLFAGTSLGGATLSPDNDANKRLYGNRSQQSKSFVVTPSSLRPPVKHCSRCSKLKFPRARVRMVALGLVFAEVWEVICAERHCLNCDRSAVSNAPSILSVIAPVYSSIAIPER